MWGRLVIGAALAFVPGAAAACTCDDPNAFSAAEIEKAARHLIDNGMLVAEVERLETTPPAPFRFRIVRKIAGPALGNELRVASGAEQLPDGQWLFRPMTSCDSNVPTAGRRQLIVFRRIDAKGERPTCGVLPKGAWTEWRMAGLCEGSLIENPKVLARVRSLARAQAGVSRSSRPLSSSR